MSLTDADRQWISAQLERVETALHSAALRAIDLELESVSDRVWIKRAGI